MYLPLTAVLGGRLFVIPEGYKEAQRDVIRLSSDIAELTEQQGHIECEPLPILQGGPVLPVALHCTLVVTPAQVILFLLIESCNAGCPGAHCRYEANRALFKSEKASPVASCSVAYCPAVMPAGYVSSFRCFGRAMVLVAC